MNTPLTPADIESLQGRELDVAVAMWMGWKKELEPYHQVGHLPDDMETCYHWITPGGDYMGGLGSDDEFSPSSKLEDTVLVENEIERRGLTEQYVEALSEIVAPEYASIFNSAIELDRHGADIDGHNFLWRMVHASPEQRCRAALKAVSG